MENNGLLAYQTFHAIKLHFTSNYDYFRYNGKVKLNAETFLKDKSKFTYYKISRKYSVDDMKDFYVSNFVEAKVKWVGDLMSEESEDCYRAWMKRQQSLSYMFEQELEFLFLPGKNAINNLMVVNGGQHPQLLQYLLQRKVSNETIVMLNRLLPKPFFPAWDKNIEEDLIWPEIRKTLEKYEPFIHYDSTKMKSILVSKVKEHW
jgi:hypothetical protein